MTKKSAKQKIVKANLTRIFEVIFSETSKNFCSFHLKIPILFKLSEAIVQRCSVKNFTKFTGRLMCQSLLFNKVAGMRRL